MTSAAVPAASRPSADAGSLARSDFGDAVELRLELGGAGRRRCRGDRAERRDVRSAGWRRGSDAAPAALRRSDASKPRRSAAGQRAVPRNEKIDARTRRPRRIAAKGFVSSRDVAVVEDARDGKTGHGEKVNRAFGVKRSLGARWSSTIALRASLEPSARFAHAAERAASPPWNGRQRASS